MGSTLPITVQSEGTLITIPPHIANTSRVASCGGVILAARRSISQPPMMAVASPPRKSGELLRRTTPLRIAVADRIEFEDAGGSSREASAVNPADAPAVPPALPSFRLAPLSRSRFAMAERQ